MKFKVFHITRNRYLSNEELEGQFFYNGFLDGTEDDNIGEFRINLLTGKIQTDHDNSCSDSDCCSPCEMFADDDDFELIYLSNRDEQLEQIFKEWDDNFTNI